jgi:hypothetical protein
VADGKLRSIAIGKSDVARVRTRRVIKSPSRSGKTVGPRTPDLQASQGGVRQAAVAREAIYAVDGCVARCGQLLKSGLSYTQVPSAGHDECNDGDITTVKV